MTAARLLNAAADAIAALSCNEARGSDRRQRMNRDADRLRVMAMAYGAKPVPILPPTGERREVFARVMAAGKAVHGDDIGLVYVDASPRAVFQRMGDPVPYYVDIADSDFIALTR